MPVLEIAVGSLKYNLSCKDDETDAIKDLSKCLNRKVNTLALKTGRINDNVLFMLLALINSRKVSKLKKVETEQGGFEDTLVHATKQFSDSLNQKGNKQTLGDQLLVANLLLEAQLQALEKNLSKEEKSALDSKQESSGNLDEMYDIFSKELESISDHIDKILVENL
jgi:cell division protein ZapA (FtsZ GTPase activity inhibitor)